MDFRDLRDATNPRNTRAASAGLRAPLPNAALHSTACEARVSLQPEPGTWPERRAIRRGASGFFVSV